MAFNNNFFGNVFVGALAGSVFTTAAIVIKNNMAASVTGALVGSLIVVAAYCGENEFQIQRLQNTNIWLEARLKEQSAGLEEQSADVAATPN